MLEAIALQSSLPFKIIATSQASIFSKPVKTLHNSQIEALASDLNRPCKLNFSHDELPCVSVTRLLSQNRTKTTPFSPNSIYSNVRTYTTKIAADGDPADVYYPVLPDTKPNQLPIALILQGALIDKADYSSYAKKVASYGFVVVVPNNKRTVTGPNGQATTGFLSDQKQVNDVLAQIKLEDANTASPIYKIVDTEKLGLLGHSFGGYAGLAAIQNINDPVVSSGNYTRPPELKAGIFYGTSFQTPPDSGTFPAIENQEIPIGLIAGTRDSIANFGEVASTYDKIQSPPKALIAIAGANHYSITNKDNVTREPKRPTLNQAAAIDAIGRWSGLFLRANLLGDRGAFDYVYNTGGDLDSNVSTIGEINKMNKVNSR